MRHTVVLHLALALTALGCARSEDPASGDRVGGSVQPLTISYPPGGIFQSATVSDPAPCAGRPVLVTATAQDPTNASLPVSIIIDGTPGAPQLVQFMAPAPVRRIALHARTRSGATDSQVITIAVIACPEERATLQMLSSQNPYHPGRVDFRAKLTGRRPRAFRWFFGDGVQQVTTEPFVSHDYANLLDHQGVHGFFNALVQETGSGLASGRRLAVGSTVASAREMGFAQAEVRTSVTPTGSGFIVGVDLRNHESAPIVFDRYLKQYLPCDTRQRPHVVAVAAESVLGPQAPIVHPAGVPSPGQVTLRVGAEAVRSRLVLPLEKIPPETCALGFNLIGRSGRRPAHASFYLPVRRNRERTRAVTDPRTLQALKHLVKQNLVADANHVDGEQLHLLEQRGLVEATSTGWRRAK